jgi:transcription elongation factor GreB
MSEREKNYITPAGFQRLQAEYNKLVQGERPRLVETVAWAASNGDRSENADYIYGKKRLREIDKRLGFLSGRLDRAEVVDPKKLSGTKVVFGATVTVSDEDGIEKTYQIVGEDELDMGKGSISWKSPMAKALLGKGVGDEVQLQAPSGASFLTIEKLIFS